MAAAIDHIAGIAKFLAPKIRRRYLALHSKSLDRAFRSVWKGHSFPYDERKVRICEIRSTCLDDQLSRLGAPKECWFVRECNPVDHGLDALKSAVRNIEGGQTHAIISCVPGKLIYFEGEWSSESRILVAN